MIRSASTGKAVLNQETVTLLPKAFVCTCCAAGLHSPVPLAVRVSNYRADHSIQQLQAMLAINNNTS